MTRFKSISVFLLLAFLVSSSAFAMQPQKKYRSTFDKKMIETNLLIGLNSDNRGLQISSANFLGEYKISKAVIPLMKVLKSSECDELKVQAALALVKIGDPRGIFAVKQAIHYDKNSSVRRFCNIFYSAHLAKNISD